MKLTIMKKERAIALVELGNEISIVDYESVVIYQKIILENMVIEKLMIKEKIVIV